MHYEYIYILLFIYISFEAFYELSLRWGKKHIELKRKLSFLKEGSTLDYLIYKVKTLFIPIGHALWNRKVLIGVVIYQVHHHFIVELMHSAGENSVSFEHWTNVGMWIAVILAAIVSTARYGR